MDLTHFDLWQKLMDEALLQAKRAGEIGEVPVGAILVDDKGRSLCQAHNESLTLSDPTAHAEILALRRGAKAIKNYRLSGMVLVCTLEPCIMCLGALVQARISGLVFGALDPKAGAVCSRLNCWQDLDWLNHRFWTLSGIREQESKEMLQSFFHSRR